MTIIALVAGLVVLTFGFVVAFGAPYVPSLRKELRLAFGELYPLSKRDVLVDLGSGDGVVLKEAADYGATLYGYELNPILVLFSRIRLGKQAKIYLANMWKVRLPMDVTVVYVFTITRDCQKLSDYVQSEANRLNRSFDVVTYGEKLPDRTPTAELRGHKRYHVIPLQNSIA